MEEKAEITVFLSRNDVKNYTVSDSSFCCANNKSTTSSSSTNVLPYKSESLTKCSATEKDYLRQETLTALTWATCRAFKYRPSDPIHYLAHQLLRWRYGDVTNRNAIEANQCEDMCTGELSKKLMLPRDD